MRSLAPIALLGSFLLAGTAPAQSLAEHAAAASGATVGTAAGKPLSNAITKIFGQTDTSTKKAASASVSKTPAKPEAEAAPLIPPAAQSGGGIPSLGGSSSGGGATPSRHGGFAQRSTAQYAAINPPEPAPAVQEPPRKEPTAEELAGIHVGASEQELVSTLGPPESTVTIPDDGHLVQICQYWSKGKQLGTVRLDNGQVVSVNQN
jgi:hypothetical protein